MTNFVAVYPAYHPVMEMHCNMCNRLTDSVQCLAIADSTQTYVCYRCIIAFCLTITQYQQLLVDRDRRELNEYGSLY